MNELDTLRSPVHFTFEIGEETFFFACFTFSVVRRNIFNNTLHEARVRAASEQWNLVEKSAQRDDQQAGNHERITLRDRVLLPCAFFSQKKNRLTDDDWRETWRNLLVFLGGAVQQITWISPEAVINECLE